MEFHFLNRVTWLIIILSLIAVLVSASLRT